MELAQHELFSEVEQTHWWFAARRRILCRLAARLLPPSKDHWALDIGCGTGCNTAALGEHYTSVGVDASPGAIRLAESRFPHIQFFTATLPDDLARDDAPHRLREAVGRAGLFLLADVLEHVADDRRAFARLVAMARPGAYFLITVPADMALWSPHDENQGHHRRYDRAEIERLWQGLPIQPVLVSYFNARLYPVIRSIRAVNRLRGKSCGRAQLDLSMPAWWINRVLARIFTGEGRRLEAALQGRTRGYSRGVSLVALVRRRTAAVAKRACDVPPRPSRRRDQQPVTALEGQGTTRSSAF